MGETAMLKIIVLITMAGAARTVPLTDQGAVNVPAIMVMCPLAVHVQQLTNVRRIMAAVEAIQHVTMLDPVKAIAPATKGLCHRLI